MEEEIKWLVVFKRDGSSPPEIYIFSEKGEASKFYEQLVLNWTDVFLCKVELGPMRRTGGEK